MRRPRSSAPRSCRRTPSTLLKAILDVCRRFPLKKRSRITFEYVLLNDVNDTPEDARRLARLLSGIKAKVNLIPLNAAPGIPFERPSDARIDRFAQILADRHLTVSVRKSRGRDIRAACGQLIVEGGSKKSAAQQMAVLLLNSRTPTPKFFPPPRKFGNSELFLINRNV